jgi:hypothetical protein
LLRIFYHTAEQKAEAEAYIANKQRKHIETIATAVLPVINRFELARSFCDC